MDSNKPVNQPVSPPVSLPPPVTLPPLTPPASSPPPSQPPVETPVIQTKPKTSINFLTPVLTVLILIVPVFIGITFLTRSKKSPSETTSLNKKEGSLADKSSQLGPGEKKELAYWQQPDQFLALPVESQKSEIAQEILSWLDEQRDSRGVYIYGYRCSVTGGCSQQEADNRAGLTAIWGRFKHYQATNDSNDLSIINKDLNIYTNSEKVPVMQNNFWNCKLMYEMWQSNLFSQEQKDKIEQICYQGAYYPPDLEEINQQINLGQTKTADFNQLLEEKSEASLTPQNRSSQGIKLAEYAAYASDFVTKYLWQKNKTDLTRAQLYFNKGVNLLVQESTNSYLEGKCVLATAALDIYQATSDSAYLNFSQLLLEKEKIQDLCLNPQEEVGYCYNSMFEQATCGLFINQLATLTKEEQYKELKDGFITYSTNNLFNLPEYTDGNHGQGAFYSKIKLSDEELLIYKSVRENGLLVGLLMME